MIDRHIFDARKAICERCSFWKNQCLKGHRMNSPVGCPVNKFAGVNGAGIMPDSPVKIASAAPCTHCDEKGVIRSIGWTEALGQFQQAVDEWNAAGRPLVSQKQHAARISVCKKCPGKHYQHFQCKLCKCVVFLKAKLPTETCPANYWPRS